MHILLIGGTVFMGPHVVRCLLEEGHKVTVFHRGNTEPDFPAGVNRIYGDRNELDQHTDALRRIRPDAVIDMVCFTEAQARQLVETLGSLAGRIVLASSMDVYAAYGGLIGIEEPEISDAPLTEDSPLRSVRYPYRGETPRGAEDPRQWLDDYDKILCEEIVMSASACDGVVVRLPMVFGEADRQLRLLPLVRRMDDGRPAIILDRASAEMKLTRGYCANMGQAIALAATSDHAARRTYNVAFDRPLTEYDWIRLVAAATGWDGEIALPDAAELPDSLKPAHNPAYSLYADTSRIREELGFSENVALDEALRQTVNWQRSNYPDPLPEAMFDYAAEDKVIKAIEFGAH